MIIFGSACALALLGFIAFVLIFPRLLKDPEVTNVADLEPVEELPDLPEFWVSDPGMTRPSTHKIQAQAEYPDGAGGAANAAYFLRLRDGRCAFGYTGDGGFTSPIYTEQETPYEIYWIQDAIVRFRALGKADGGQSCVGRKS